MICEKLIKGYDARCEVKGLRIWQKLVLINFDDIDFGVINNTTELHNIIFGVSDNLTGYGFYNLDVGSSVSSNFSMERVKGVAMYNHSVQMFIQGVNENIKTLQKQLDKGRFICAVKYSDGTIEIHGYNYGMIVNPYSYEKEGIIELQSVVSEYVPPYIYTGNSEDFDNNWNADDQAINLLGEFNNDFNIDFKRNYTL